jgi:uncharacterized protein (TIGR02466 family)
MNLIGLFPKPVGEFYFNKQLSKKQLSFLSDQKQKSNVGNSTSEFRKILDDKCMKSLREFIDDSISEYIANTYAPKFDVKLHITQSWTNYTKPGQFHHKHSHANSFVSGVFYVNADPNKDKIYFFKNDNEQIKLDTENWNMFNSESWWIPVETNKLILFPSSLTHMVETVEAEETRISLAFNTFPKGYIGNDDTLTGLHL